MTGAILINGVKEHYKPGDLLTGEVQWEGAQELNEVRINLYWYTEGRGDQDIVIVDTKTSQASQITGSISFSFHLPDSPYSFSGKLITLIWAVEAFAGGASEVQSFSMSPFETEIKLGEIAT